MTILAVTDRFDGDMAEGVVCDGERAVARDGAVEVAPSLRLVKPVVPDGGPDVGQGAEMVYGKYLTWPDWIR